MFRYRALLVLFTLFVTSAGCFGAVPEETCAGPPEGSKGSALNEKQLAEEASRRVDDLGKQSFFVVRQVRPEEPAHFEFLIEKSDNLVCLWFATAQGTPSMELRGPNGPLLLEEDHGQQRFKGQLEAGKYVVDVKSIDRAGVYGVIGIKRSAVEHGCYFDPHRLIERKARPEKRYSSPYLLVKPVGRAADGLAPGRAGTLIVVPNNTGFESINKDLLHDSAICELKFDTIAGPLALADGLGAPLLMPLFPRPPGVYTQALSRDSLNPKQDKPEFRYIDKQLIAMIDDARIQLRSMHHPVQRRVVMTGFSASGMFTNRFAVLHPERVLAAAVGSPGGWPIAPVRSDQGRTLTYPVGIADLDTEELGWRSVDLAALRRVPFLFQLGVEDNNDSVPCTDSFSKDQAELINALFGRVREVSGENKCAPGPDPVLKRWWSAQRLYHAARMNALFKLYPGVGHDMTPVMWSDVLDFFRTAIRAR